MLEPRTRLGRYYIVRHIKTGGMGAVYRAEDPETGQVVAIKTMVADAALKSEAYTRFLREARAACSIRHRNVIQIYGFDVHQGTPYLVMEYLRGEALNELIKRSPLSIERVTDIGAAVCSAMAAVHDHQILHRDLKPSNIYLADSDEGEQVKVLDFGVSKLCARGTDLKMTASHTIVGSIHYMSPEQARGLAIDERSDQFAIGVILYEALTGQRPHLGETIFEISDAIIHGRHSPPRARRPEIPEKLEEVVLMAMNLEAEHRFSSVRELGAALLPFASLEGQRRLTDLLSGSPAAMRRGLLSAALPAGWFKTAGNDEGLGTTDQGAGILDEEQHRRLARGLAPTELRRSNSEARRSTTSQLPGGQAAHAAPGVHLLTTASLPAVVIGGPSGGRETRLFPTVTSPVPGPIGPDVERVGGADVMPGLSVQIDDLAGGGQHLLHGNEARSRWRALGMALVVLLVGALAGIAWLEVFPDRRKAAAPPVSAPARDGIAPAAALGPTSAAPAKAAPASQSQSSAGMLPSPAPSISPPTPTITPAPGPMASSTPTSEARLERERPVSRRLAGRSKRRPSFAPAPRAPEAAPPPAAVPPLTNNGVLILE